MGVWSCYTITRVHTDSALAVDVHFTLIGPGRDCDVCSHAKAVALAAKTPRVWHC